MLRIIVLTSLVAGCAPTSSTKLVSRNQELFARHAEPVCFLRSPLPSDIPYTRIGEIRGGKKTYGSVSEIIPLMAEEARSLGADAVVNLNTGQRMGAWAWARPVGTGVAVKLAKRTDLDCIARGGEWR